jgi:molybdenum cofactor cytidylyltransferase
MSSRNKLHQEKKDKVNILILAAGSSSRLGQSKQLLKIQGVPLLRKTVLTALATASHSVTVVLGHNFKEHLEAIQDLEIDVLHHVDWQNGMGSSIKAGVSHILKTQGDTQAIVILVCDQPYLTTEHLNSLIAARRTSGASIVASAYASTTGVPALFGKSMFAGLLELKAEEGAKKIMEKHAPSMVEIQFPPGEIDIDTPSDYARFTR